MSTQIQTLVPIIESKINDEITQTVNARELHKFLEVKNYFREWIKDRITKYNFVENVDYIKFIENSSHNLDAESTAASESTTYEVPKMGQVGKEATKYCRTNSIRIDKTHDPRFGTVNVYPVDVLVLVCKTLFPNHNFDVVYI